MFRLRATITHPRKSPPSSSRCLRRCHCRGCIGSANPRAGSSVYCSPPHPERIASLVLCNTPTRISDEIKGIYALGRESTAAAIRAYGTGEWCRRTLGYRLDVEHASEALREWCIAEMDKTRPDIAAGLHECFEAVDVRPLLTGIEAPVLLLSGDKSRIASEQQKIFAETLPHGRLELFAGYGHGVNLLQPERCARAALEFWRTVEEAQR